ncbi:hypothetical protein JW949_00005, partial [Candidatus Woesearchaeota archaeon]|nr:hypothetical protein [Candidatus Woesearchaeota archaeon]
VYEPSGSNDPTECQIRALKDGEVIKETKMPLNFQTAYGMDYLDNIELNKKIDELIKSLTEF